MEREKRLKEKKNEKRKEEEEEEEKKEEEEKQEKNKSNRTTMRPLGVYLIVICKYIFDVIQVLMILGDFGGFA